MQTDIFNFIKKDLQRSYDVVLLDMNNIANACLYQKGLQELKVFNGASEFYTGAILGSVNIVHSLISKFPNSLFVALWDGSAKEWRRKFCPTYKISRRADVNSDDLATQEKARLQEMLRGQLPYLRQLLHSLGVAQVWSSLAEADDFAGLLCQNFKESSLSTLLVTGDKDYLQSLREGVDWYRPASPQKIYHHEMIESGKFEVDGVVFSSPANFLECRFLAGDPSDEIPGCAGVGLKTAYKYLQEFGSFEKMWSLFDSGEYSPKGKKAASLCSKDTRRLYYANREIMDFSRARFFNFDDETVISREDPDLDRFTDLCRSLNFTKIGGYFNAFRSNHTSSGELWEASVRPQIKENDSNLEALEIEDLEDIDEIYGL